MNNRLIVFFMGLLLIGFASCKLFSYASYAKKYSISFGSGGGFSGGVDEYILSGNGEIKEWKAFSKDSTTIKTLSKKDIKKVFKMAESKNLDSIKLDETGNMTSFIRVYEKGKLIRSYQWPSGKVDLPKPIADLNTLLQQLKQP